MAYSSDIQQLHHILATEKLQQIGASTYHSGIDIGAPSGTNIYSICDGKVIFTGFNGGYGYTVTVENGNFKISYCHVSPFFIVYTGQTVTKGMLIANVGPKNVYGVSNNPYKDSNRKSNKWRNNGSSSSFDHKKRRPSRQSFKLHIIIFIFVTTTIAISTAS